MHLQLPPNKQGMRIGYAVLTACGISFLLFSLMQFLVSGSSGRVLNIPAGSTMQFIRLHQDSETQLKQRQLPRKPKPPANKPPAPTSIREEFSRQQFAKPSLELPDTPELALHSRPVLGGFDGMSMSDNNDLMPIYRVEPDYPRKAARTGKEGWVEVKFTVLEDGTVTAAKVIKAEPRRIFNRSALRAISKWKFSPKVVDGKAVKQTASQVIYFKLAK